MSKNIFIDANIILDIFDKNRPLYEDSLKFYTHVVKSKYSLFASCDIITTLYYIDSKKYKEKTLTKILDISKILKIIEFSNKEVEQTCSLMIEDKDYKDLEDTIQYILAKKLKCELIISNDKRFISKDIKLLSSTEFCKEYKLI